MGVLGERVQVKRPFRIRHHNPDNSCRFWRQQRQVLYGQIRIRSSETCYSRRLAVAVLAMDTGHAWQQNHGLQSDGWLARASPSGWFRPSSVLVLAAAAMFCIPDESRSMAVACLELVVRARGCLSRPPPGWTSTEAECAPAAAQEKAEIRVDDESVPDDMPESGDSPKSG